ncbi:MAG: hypothetical protein NTU76_01425, partial [Candidatus Taylorbacteria bacterium]|nr:hypothetical protein [Candidatus Taylorbacteria bacterium]
TAIVSLRKKLIKIGNNQKIGRYSFFIGSPWNISKSKLIKVIKDKPFDIRDTFISVAVVKISADNKPEMILCQNFKISLQDNLNYKKGLNEMLNTVDTAIVSLRKKLIKIGNNQKIGRYSFFIGSPWSISKSKLIKVIKDKPFDINESFLKKVILSDEEYLINKISLKTEEKEWKILEEKVIQSKLNGYKVEKIYGKKASDIELEIFVSFIPYEIKDRLSFFVDKKNIWGIKRTSNSCILSSYSFLRDLFSDKNDFVYIDIGNNLTDIYIVKEDIIHGIISFPLGEEDIIESISKRTNTLPEIIKSKLNLNCSVGCDEKTIEDIGNLVKTGLSMWLFKFRSTVSRICNEKDLPNNIFMITNTDLTKLFANELKNNDSFNLLRNIGGKTDVVLINESVIDNQIINGNVFSGEPYVKMDLIFLYKLIKQK